MSTSRNAMFALGAVLPLACGAMVRAQAPTCDPGKRVNECYSQLAGLIATRATAADVAAKPTGSEANIAGSETAIRDFLPRFASSIAIPGLSAVPKALGLRFNIKPNDAVWRLPLTLQLEGVANEGKLYDALVANVPQVKRSVVQDSVTKTLSDFADVGVSLAFNLEGKVFGRSYVSTLDEIAKVFEEAIPSNVEAIASGLELLTSVLRTATPSADCGSGARVNMPLRCFGPQGQADIVENLTALHETVAVVEARSRSMRVFHFDRIDDLVNNQPQLSLTGNVKLRDQLVGPNEQKATLRAEFSPVSVNSARDYCLGVLGAECLRKYLAQDGVLASLDRGDRVWLSADIARSSRYDFAMPADSARVTKARSLVVEPAIGAGSYLGVADQRVRFDAELRYRFSDNETVRENRWVGTATFTQKVSDQSNGVFTLKWASKPEFLGDVDKKWRANIGYSYKVSDIPK